jgi:ribosomal protein S18 acetylase RimI-like enzyme
VGFGSISFERTIRGGIIGHIEDVIVKEAFRRAGIGGKVVHELIARAQEYGCYRITLGSETRNETFYKDLGFSAAGILFCKYLGDGKAELLS